MSYGGIDFEHVWAFQIKCMMANQYDRLIEAIAKNNPDLIIAVCLRLGWNDAFKHVSENIDDYNNLSDDDKSTAVQTACIALVDNFKEYAQKKSTMERYNLIDDWLERKTLNSIFSPIKNVASATYPLCLGHIQKMFNIAMKLLLCLIVSAEHANTGTIKIKLGEFNMDDVYLTDHDLLSFSNFPYTFATADCPVDHYILEAIDANKTKEPEKIKGHRQFKHIVWSKMGAKESKENYIIVQKEIKNIQKGTNKCNLCFDFENWN